MSAIGPSGTQTTRRYSPEEKTQAGAGGPGATCRAEHELVPQPSRRCAHFWRSEPAMTVVAAGRAPRDHVRRIRASTKTVGVAMCAWWPPRGRASSR